MAAAAEVNLHQPRITLKSFNREFDLANGNIEKAERIIASANKIRLS